jgi:hypothetical protein
LARGIHAAATTTTIDALPERADVNVGHPGSGW